MILNEDSKNLLDLEKDFGFRIKTVRYFLLSKGASTKTSGCGLSFKKLDVGFDAFLKLRERKKVIVIYCAGNGFVSWAELCVRW